MPSSPNWILHAASRATLIEADDAVLHDGSDKQAGKALVGEAVNGGPVALLNGTYGTFDLPHMGIGRDDVEVDGGKMVAEAVKFMIGMNVGDCETVEVIHTDGLINVFYHGGFGTVIDGVDQTMLQLAGDEVQER
jgi:hypothetical protein